MMKILFICSSNVCRSPYCEYVFKKLIKDDEKLKEKIDVKSAAVVNISKEIFPKAIPSLMKEGFSEEEIRAHKPCYILKDYKRFKEADVIIGMSYTHMLFMPITLWKKYKPLSVIASGKYKQIPDPFLYKSQEAYDKCMDVLKDYLIQYYNKLKEEIK